ncbi:MAG: symmetrical bis(5'-nucleosyl)-tetraphosphatase [Gammaproteobacteria bacterium]|nr:symmetrical bis(5'-nucleosyl)-tetraphosphatase [Gammaproteobacteria bacterium]
MAVYAIGDLQGCFDPFRRLLDKINFDPSADKLWLTGDLVNRGPKSRRSLRFVRSLGDAAITVLGNHDLHLIALAHDVGIKTDRFDSMWKILAADDCDELIDWLRSRPLAHYDEALNTLLVHAGIPPQWTCRKTLKRAAEVEAVLRGPDYADFLEVMYGNKPDRWSGKLKGDDRLRFIVNCLTRMRMLTADGRLDFNHSGPPEAARKGLIPWFQAPGARWAGTRIVFGHWSALGLLIDEDVISIDTGCVWGRQLTAVRLDTQPKIRQVDCG